ncbi:MAG: ABC transporter substrate-binding protein [Chloroflexi bacterium]|nr:ABC transporter substrate-binding protein [Chloroflexota bacterium]
MKGKDRFFRWILVAVLIGVVVGAGCTAPPAAPPTPGVSTRESTAPTPKPAPKIDKVKIVLPSKATTLLNFWIGRDKGIYKEEGIDLEILTLRAPLMRAALMSGEVDYSGSLAGFFESAVSGLPFKLLLTQMRGGIWHLIVGPGISTAQDLKGKIVAVQSIGATAHYSTRETVRFVGLDPDKDVTFIALEQPESLTALKTGAIGGAGLTSPFDAVARDMGFKELAFSRDAPTAPPSTNGLATSEKKWKENRDQVKRMIRAHLKSLAFIRDHAEESIAYMQKEFDLDQKASKTAYDEIVGIFSYDGTMEESKLQSLITMGKATGAIKEVVAPIDKIFDRDLLKEVQKELGISK